MKKKDLKDIVKVQKPDMLYLQESKWEGVDRKLCSLLWQDDDFYWVAKNAMEGLAGC